MYPQLARLAAIALTVLAAVAGPASGAGAGRAGASGPGSEPVEAGPPRPFVFVQGGDVFLTDRTGTFRITTSGGASWPRISPDRTRIAYAQAGDVWVADVSDSGGHIAFTRISHDGRAGGPSWSPRGDRLAYRSGTAHHGTTVLAKAPPPGGGTPAAGASTPGTDPTDRAAPGTGQAAPGAGRSAPGTGLAWPGPGQAGESGGTAAADATGWSVLREANTVAWSPDGRSLAYPGGSCSATYDDCLTVLDLGTGAESTVAGFDSRRPGFATTPSWSADSRRLYVTRQVGATPGPVTATAYDLAGRGTWQVGADGDSTPVPVGNGRFLVTARTAAGDTVTYLPGDGSRQALSPGAQPDWNPGRPG
ncbi:hypothetical protein R8Z50_20750 [Longispora sp. K20-0274]|uniref:TolB family protein n=1 Tax=Longispora sp. K20-0274 TaxID=3088255 RepID=UPI00399C0C50